MNSEDLDTLRFQEESMKKNISESGWLQFNVHFYDGMKLQSIHQKAQALKRLEQQVVTSVP